MHGGSVPHSVSGLSAHEWEAVIGARSASWMVRKFPSCCWRDSLFMASNIPLCLARAAWHRTSAAHCETPVSEALNENVFSAEQKAAAHLARVKVVDLTSEFCSESTCPPATPNLIVYRDDNHITATYAARLCDDLGIHILPLIRKLRLPGDQ